MTQPALLHPPPDSNEPAVCRDPRPSRTAPATCSLGSCQYAWLLQVRDIPCPVPGLSVVGCGCWGPCGSIWLETFCFQWGAPGWPRPNLRAALQLLQGPEVCRSPRPCLLQTRWAGEQRPTRRAGRCMCCGGGLSRTCAAGTALEAGTVNPARYFLRASHPINNSSGCW